MPHTEFPKKTIAAIDIGSNSAHMVLAEMDHVGEMRILDSDKVNLRLGQALGDDGNLSDEAIRRTVEALAHMKEIIQPYNATTRAVATHATREAKNHRQLLNAIEAATGLKVQMIDGVEEARLVFLGMRYGLVLSNIPCLGVDVGGGSTEVIVARDDDINFVSSFKLGAVTLTAKYFRNGYTAEACRDLREHIRSRLAPLPQEIRRFEISKALASSGTAKALAYLHAKVMGQGELSDPNGFTLPREALSALCADLNKLLTPQKIRDATGMDAGRAEIIVAGAMILDELTKLLKVKEWIVTSYGLREGLVADTFYRAYGRHSGELPDIQWHSVLEFAKRLQLNQSHARQVTRLALRLFHQLAPVLSHGDPDDDDADLKLLRAAAYLREAGKFISAPGYHRHALYLLANCRLPGFTEAERLLLGLIARFQRKGIPDSTHADCAELPVHDLARLRFLAAIVRLAAALDRTRQGRVLDVEVRVVNDKATVTVVHAEGLMPEVEMHKARLEKVALERSWGVSLSFTTRVQEQDS